jgi:hypothetical protein
MGCRESFIQNCEFKLGFPIGWPYHQSNGGAKVVVEPTFNPLVGHDVVSPTLLKVSLTYGKD